MRVRIGTLDPGTRCYVRELDLHVTVVYASECRCRVKIVRGMIRVDLPERSFMAQDSRETDWSAGVLVEVEEHNGT